MRTTSMFTAAKRLAAGLGLAALLAGPAAAQDKKVEILNVSYDVARELYAQLNPVFVAAWKAKSGETLDIKQSHGGSSRQARAIIEGLKADVVTFNQVLDIEVLAQRGFVAADWKKRLPNNASPYYSLPSFLVRKGNPKNVKDWNDLIRKDVQSVFPNPKTSGNSRYTYLAAYAYALETNGRDQEKAKEFVRQLFANVPVFDTGGRAATTTFVEREIGDVLITFEAETNGIRREYGNDKFDLVTPSTSLLAEFPVAVVDKVADQRGTKAVATAYLEWLYSPEAQDMLAKNFNRVNDKAVMERNAALFPAVKLLRVEDVFGSWEEIQKVHFGDGGVLDQIYAKR